MTATSLYYDRPYELVRTAFSHLEDRVDTTLNVALTTMAALSNIPTVPESVLPSAPSLELNSLTLSTTLPPKATLFGDINPFELPSVEEIGVADVGTDPLPTFVRSIGQLTMPNAPPPINLSNKPTRPTLSAITLPAIPSVSTPELDSLTAITVPTFSFPELPTFDGTAPAFDGSSPTTLLQWADPVYASTNLTAIQARISTLLAGGTGIPLAIEAALFDRARSREDQTSLKATQEAFDTFAGRGFAMPPGMLVQQVNAITEANQMKASAINRDILVQAATWEIDNLKFAVQQGIGLESTLIGMFQNMAQRAFEAARYRVESEISLFNAQVALFNARQNAYQVSASVYKTRVDGALAKLEVFKAEIQAAVAVGQLNEQKVKVFQARLEGVRNQIEIYKAQMTGAQVQSEFNKNLIESYGVDVKAYAEGLQGQKYQYDAYDSQVKAEIGKAQVLDAEARAFASTIQAYDSKNNIKVKVIDARIAAMGAATQRFAARASAERERITGQLGVIQARAEAYRADVGRYSAELSSDTARNESNARQLEARLRNNLAYYEIMVKEYDQRMTRLIEQTKLHSDNTKAAGQMAAALAAGGMAALHVSATMTGTAGISSTETFQHTDQL